MTRSTRVFVPMEKVQEAIQQYFCACHCSNQDDRKGENR